MESFVDVILPLALKKSLTYAVPSDCQHLLVPGMRVVVPVGEAKLYTAIVHKVNCPEPTEYKTKPIHSILDDFPIVTENQLKFWELMAQYYMCSLGEVMTAALPAGLKLTSDSKFRLNEDIVISQMELTEREYLLAEAMEVSGAISVNDATKILGIKSVQKYIKALVDKGIAVSEQELKRRYSPKMEKYIGLNEQYWPDEALERLFAELEKSPRQSETLTLFLSKAEWWNNKSALILKKLLAGTSPSAAASINALVKKGVFNEQELESDRIKKDNGESIPVSSLSEAQLSAYEEIKSVFTNKDVILLHGVTSSGKTEIYLQLIQDELNKGNQVLYLVPEIALTTQLIARIKKHFPGKIAVYHSKFNENERVETWNKMLMNDEYQLIIGARSSLFLPYRRLGLVIVDEEHESSFKQHDPAPRYSARDFSMVLAAQFKAKVLLGSATPSIESYYNANSGKYGLVKLNERFGSAPKPAIEIADLSQARKEKVMQSHFHPLLIETISNALIQKEQVILFRNRRGHSLMLKCEKCGHIPFCKNCDISLTYYKNIHQLRCRYCGYTTDPPQKCGACGHPALNLMGFGTEKIEEELPVFFPNAHIARLDLDSATGKYGYIKLLQQFEGREIDILVGTQMVSKGLDFDNVSTVGILDADSMLSFPDFRANERSFQMMTQVAGRAGRRKKQGLVIIQTDKKEHPIIQSVIEADYDEMYRAEIEERRTYHYPPYSKLINIKLKHADFRYTKMAADYYGGILRKAFGKRVLGPEQALVGRVKNQYIFELMLKFDRKENIAKAKEIILQSVDLVYSHIDHKNVKIFINVDPQ